MRARLCVAGTLPGVSIVGLDHVQVAAPRGFEANARRFYGEVLGPAEVGKPSALTYTGDPWVNRLELRASA
jgi:hypothetical protein